MKAQIIEKEGKHYIKGKVVMLEAFVQTHQVKEGELFINDTRKHSWGKLEALRCERVTQHGHAWNGTGIRTDICHLYVTSDDKVVKGDASNFIFEGKIYLSSTSSIVEHVDFTKAKKIIASTNKTLPFQPPSPSESFIKAYIEAYNNGNVIEDVLVEVNTRVCVQCGAFNPSHAYSCLYPPHPCGGKLTNTLKLKDNNIIIRKVKDSWNREEVAQIIENFSWECTQGVTQNQVKNWIEENL
jgi:ribosomal protein L40E